MKKVVFGSGPQTSGLKDTRIPKPGGSRGLFRGNGFILGLCAAVGLGFLFPQVGARNGALHPEIVGDGGIALILFLQGLSIALDKMRAGAANWRLHVTIQAFTFLVFPLVGLAFGALMPWIWPGEPHPISEGILYLCVLPSTVSTSVVLTSVAGGNVAGALFNAALSNILGVVFTPVAVHLLMAATGQQGRLGSLLGRNPLTDAGPVRGRHVATTSRVAVGRRTQTLG